MERPVAQGRFRWELATFIVFSFLTVFDVLAWFHSTPTWFSNWPHWSWQDWTSFSGDLFFPMMALSSLAVMRKAGRPNG